MARRRRTAAMNAVLRYVQDPEVSVAFSDYDSDHDDEGPEVGSRTWQCSNCPLILKEKNEVRILDPCGHVFCMHCTTQISISRCTIRTCQKRVETVITPKIEEGEPVDEKEEAERSRAERLTVKQKLRDYNDKINEISIKRKRLEKSHATQEIVLKRNLFEATQTSSEARTTADNMQLKVKLAKYLSTVENVNDPFPVVQNGSNLGKWYYLDAALATHHCFNQLAKKGEELASQEYKLTDLLNHKEVLDKALLELKAHGREDWDTDELWKEIESVTSASETKRNGFLMAKKRRL